MVDTCQIRAKKWKCDILRKICASLKFETSIVLGSGRKHFGFWKQAFWVLVASVLGSGSKCFGFWYQVFWASGAVMPHNITYEPFLFVQTTHYFCKSLIILIYCCIFAIDYNTISYETIRRTIYQFADRFRI